jgi:hypothetical protein
MIYIVPSKFTYVDIAIHNFISPCPINRKVERANKNKRVNICHTKEVKLLDKKSPMAMLEKHSQLGIFLVLISKYDAVTLVPISKIERIIPNTSKTH